MDLRRYIGFVWLIPAVWACSLIDEGPSAEPCVSAPVPVQLALSLEGGVATKANVATITEISETPDFRGISSLSLLPFATEGAVTLESTSLGGWAVLGGISSEEDDEATSDGSNFHNGLIKNNRAHLFVGPEAALPVGTASVLVYASAAQAQASNIQEYKHLNGSFVSSAEGLSDSAIDASAITFSPDPILTGSIPAAAQSIADALNAIAEGAYYTQSYHYRKGGVWYETSVAVRWNASIGSSLLAEWFVDFTNDGQLLTGAGENVANMIGGLYKRLNDYVFVDGTVYKHVAGAEQFTAYLTEEESEENVLTYGAMYNNLSAFLRDRIGALVTAGTITLNTTTGAASFNLPALRQYPVSLGLPAGSAVLRWNGNRFDPVTEGLDGIAAIDRFCYMPPLFYMSNTSLSTSTERDLYTQYTSAMPNWNSILSLYGPAKVVSSQTQAVALDEPLQYATGMLVATIKSNVAQLPDNDGDAYTYCTPSGTKFPVTGIIIGGQFRQLFNFTPDPSATEEYYLYDNLISGVYLTTEQSEPLRTLVFPTPADEDVYFFLELRNDSNVPFYGAEGIIMPGSYFYLAGCLDKPSELDNQDQVFMQDHYTTVHCVVNTLENAHVSIPELGDPQLLLGIQTSVDWVQSTGSYIVLD